MSSQNDESDSRQRTVAELLAQYGGSDGGSPRPGGRRRRAEDASDDTAPQAIINRVMADSKTDMRPVTERPHQHTGPEQANQEQPPPAQQQQTQQAHPVAPPQQAAPQQAPPVPPAQQNPQRSAPVPPPTAQPPGRPAPNRPVRPGPIQPGQRQAPGQQPMPGANPPLPPQPGPGAIQQALGQPAQPPLGQRPPVGRPPHQEQLTEQFGAVDAGPADLEGEPVEIGDDFDSRENFESRDDVRDEVPGDELHDGALDDEEIAEDEAPVRERRRRFGRRRAQDEDAVADEIPEPRAAVATTAPEETHAVDEDFADEADEPKRSSGKEWLTLIGLVLAGVIGGAAVWLGFNWLWGMWPIVAVVLAVVVIALMVFVVRKIRHTRDVQTIVFAVIAGLVVAVSPAALLIFRH